MGPAFYGTCGINFTVLLDSILGPHMCRGQYWCLCALGHRYMTKFLLKPHCKSTEVTGDCQLSDQCVLIASILILNITLHVRFYKWYKITQTVSTWALGKKQLSWVQIIQAQAWQAGCCFEDLPVSALHDKYLVCLPGQQWTEKKN